MNFVCSECGYSSLKWMGRCPSCGAWNSFKEMRDSKPSKKGMIEGHPPVSLKDIEISKGGRLKTNIGEFDRVLGGGIVGGSIILLGGEPGIGKSTLILQAAKNLSKYKVLYVSGEESLAQIKLRANRMGVDGEGILIMSEIDIDRIEGEVEKNSPGLIIIDSIQTMYSCDVDSTPGSIAQVRGVTQRLVGIAKGREIPIFIVGHVTKGGAIAGPRTLEHMVDTVLYLEGDRNHYFRILRAAKNRFGSTNEIGIFEMGEKGLEEIKDPSMLFIGEKDESVPGTSISCVLEGTRVFLVEIQALTSPTYYGYPQRVASGIDQRRLAMLLAIVEKKLSFAVSNQDVFINVVGGLKINDRACDLGIILSLVSSLKGIMIPKRLVLIGEVGLSGEVRIVSRLEGRIKEAEKLGFTDILVPVTRKDLRSKANLKQIRWIGEAVRYIKDEIR